MSRWITHSSSELSTSLTPQEKLSQGRSCSPIRSVVGVSNHLDHGNGVNTNWSFKQRLKTLPGITSVNRSMWIYSKAFSDDSPLQP